MKELRFLHISKTGGQSIARAALKQGNKMWGIHDIRSGSAVECHRLLRYKLLIDKL